MKIRTACPGCDTRYVLPSEGIPVEGKRVACRHCGQQWTIPHPGRQNAPRAATPADARPAPPAGTEDGGRVVACPHCDFHYLAATARPLEKTRTTILIAEDQTFFRTVIREALGEGFHYIVAGTVDEARRVLETAVVDLLILDLNLSEPDDGERVLEHAPEGLPTLILTGDDDPDLYGDRWKDLQAKGAGELLIKGLNIREQISSRVGSMLEKARASA